ncbi:MAG: hypothetical protein QW272_09670 [Candidatus Methanomethylicaceae archaeon]
MVRIDLRVEAVVPNIDVPLSSRASEDTLSRLKPIQKAAIFNTSISANTNIFSSDLTPTNTPCIFRIYAVFDTGGILTVKRTFGATTVSENLYSGNPLVANSAYIFDIAVRSGDSINLQYSVAATAILLMVMEIATGG